MIDFNTEPYNDDYNEDSKFYRILFRPSFAVQARELTQLQTILQNQITRHGDNIFKQGAMVVPGQVSVETITNTTKGIDYVKLQSMYNGVAVATFIDSLQGLTITGSSGLKRVNLVHDFRRELLDQGLLKRTQSDLDNFDLAEFNALVRQENIEGKDIEYQLSRLPFFKVVGEGAGLREAYNAEIAQTWIAEQAIPLLNTFANLHQATGKNNSIYNDALLMLVIIIGDYCQLKSEYPTGDQSMHAFMGLCRECRNDLAHHFSSSVARNKLPALLELAGNINADSLGSGEDAFVRLFAKDLATKTNAPAMQRRFN